MTNPGSNNPTESTSKTTTNLASAEPSIRVAIVDDQDLVRAGFRMILETEPGIDVVLDARDGQEAVDRVPGASVDVVLMDIRMPNMDGVEATRQLSELCDARVIILTTFDLDEYVFAALQGGASGFLLKDTHPDELIRAIRVVAQDEALLAPSVTKRLIEQFQNTGPAPATSKTLPGLGDLTEREAEVMTYLAKGLSNSEIGKALFVSEATVKTHVGRVLSKLGLRDRVQAIVAAYESGLVQPGQNLPD